ncbi:1-deoxy-D-xylulose-5-phosphate reductoisomerase [Ketogulonicigenium vulgare]|uniref:1-deoxy-D-xylulose-5-phosphate reductoisomerase n=1 Tax=Ketogulonicigenium vulgare TaxID=92945 RepID=UPI0023597F9C|nr:1-deoxy-D-xylulose-5-phosphate reductoisomerase [Ketogulonicigenium vulgare]
MRKVSIFGATGSVGQSTLDLIARAPRDYAVEVLTGGRNIAQLADDAVKFHAKLAITCEDDLLPDLRAALAGTGVDVAAGAAAIAEAATRPVDWAMSAIVGVAGLVPGLNIIGQGATLGLANKETLVAAGPLVMARAAAHHATIIPVDSEHSAIFQALHGEDLAAVERVIITASGGAFRDATLAEMAQATPEQAATHPNWAMGQRITIDSASMFNKALEMIEAREFFGLAPDQIEVVVHPESLIHALVGFQDGALMAHVGPPDMRHAIGYALHWPARKTLPVERLDLVKIGQMTFRAADPGRYPALRLARQVMAQGGYAGAVFNAAKERALDRFLNRDLAFLDMAAAVEHVLDQMDRAGLLAGDSLSLDQVLAMDAEARARVDGYKG